MTCYYVHSDDATFILLFLQIHLLPFQGNRFCAKDPTQVNQDEVLAARGDIPRVTPEIKKRPIPP